MSIINNNIKWVLIVIGLITCAMIQTAIAPQTGLQQSFGASISGPLAEIVVRSWALLITLTGVMLIYAGFRPLHRTFACLIACTSKVFFVALVLIYGQEFMDQAAIIIVFDTIAVLLMLAYVFSKKA